MPWRSQRQQQARVGLRHVSTVPPAESGTVCRGSVVAMKTAPTLLLGWVWITAAMQSFATEADPNSGCPHDDPAAHRQRPGEESPQRLQPKDCDPTRLPTPTTSPQTKTKPVDR